MNMASAPSTTRYAAGMEYLVEVVQRLSLATDLATVVDVVRKAARTLSGADGATFVLRDGELCHYVDEDAIAPLWRGQRFPLDTCVSGWAMTHGRHVAIEDIYADERVPADAYRPTFVKSLVMVPIRVETPIGAIGAYWATHHRAEEHEIRLLQSLAHSTSVALTNIELVANLKTSLEETRKARDELARQLRLRDDFISLASHELRTPLTPLYMQMHVLRDATSDLEGGDTRAADRITRASKLAERQLGELGGLAERMLDASRVSLGRLELAVEDGVDLGEVTRAAVDEVRAPAGTPVNVRAEEAVVGRWDAARLQRVVRTLVDNAVKFGVGRPVDVEVSCAGDGGARLLVRDRGIGIASSDHQRIFERFERAAETTSYRGLGLGLHVARAIVEAHGGTISVASAPGEGAELTVSLPCS